MPSPLHPGSLTSRDWDQLHEWANRFEEAWRKGDSPDLASHLPGQDEALRMFVLVELIKIDLEFRWKKKKNVFLETYQGKFPELSEHPTFLASLLAEEFRVRRKAGDEAPLGLFRKRYPQIFEEFSTLLDPAMRSAAQPSETTDGEETMIHDRTNRPTGQGTQPISPMNTQEPVKSRPAPVDPPPTDAFKTKANQSVSIPGGGGYKLLHFLGRGQFGEVWRAEAPGGVPVAIKIIFRSLETDQSQRELESLEIIKNLNHPFLVQTQAYWPLEDRLYIVMELADQSLGGRLKECLKKTGQPVPVQEAIYYLREAAEALDFLHSQNVLHRDIKPDNIMLVTPRKSISLNTKSQSSSDLSLAIRAHVKVADFGLARMFTNAMQTASIAGAPAYMGPEVWRGKITPQSDQYALAVTYVQLRLNRLPIRAGNIASLMNAHLENKPDLTGMEEGEIKVITRALDKDPENRYESCLEMVGALEAVFAKKPEPPPKPKVPATTWVALVIMAGLLIGMGGWFVTSRLKPGEYRVSPMDAIGFRAGEPVTAAFRVDRIRYREPISLKFVDVPDHVKMAPVELGPEEETAKVEVTSSFRANLTQGTKQYPIKMIVASAGKEDIHEVTLAISPAQYVLPPLPKGTRIEVPEDAAIRADSSNVRYLDQFDLVKDNLKVRFLLIARKDTDTVPVPTFYMMRTKVTFAMFQVFADNAKPPLENLTWEKPKLAGANYPQPDLPVFGVSIEDAVRFGHWLGGSRCQLPTAKQWDQAAGRFELFPDQGPYLLVEDENYTDKIAVRRGKLGPMKVGTATHDRSKFGVTDMAGNGREFTRNIVDQGKLVPLANPELGDQILLRGVGFLAKEPLRFIALEQFENRIGSHPFVIDYVLEDATDKMRLYDVGFRVVLEP